MAGFDLNNFLIDRVRRGTMFSDTTGEALWSITQITDATLSMTSETADVTDAIGNIITQFDRSKNAEFSGTNALWDLGLSAAQFGSAKTIATAAATILTPAYEQLRIANAKVVLAHVPEGTSGAEVKYIYALNDDSTLGKKYTVGASVTADTFTVDAANKTINTPTGLTGNVAVFYDYAAEDAVMLQNNAVDFPKAGKFMLEVIGKDTCDKTATYVAYIVFPNAKLRVDSDLSFTSDGGHPFTITCMQDYCDLEKRLFNIYVAQ